MTRSRAEIEAALLSGETVDRIQLVTPQQRRVFRFFLGATEWPVTNFDAEYVKSLKAAFLSDDLGNDEIGDAPTSPAPHEWTLTKIEAENFGGVNTYNGKPFLLELDGESICIEGYNGQGKTSLASAIVWGLTGQRLSNWDRSKTS